MFGRASADGGAEGQVDIHRHAVDLIRRTNPCPHLPAQLRRLDHAGKCEGHAIALKEGNRHVDRHDCTRALADLHQQLLAEARAKRILDVQQVFDLPHDQQAFRWHRIAFDCLPLYPGEARVVQKSCISIVLIEPIEQRQLPAQRACANADYSTNDAEKGGSQ